MEQRLKPTKPTTRRAAHRHPVYGGQARRGAPVTAYVVGFAVIVLVLAAFMYTGLKWATGPGREAALVSLPTPTAVPVVTPSPPPPSPTVGEQTYIVKPGDSPASIAARFHVRTADLESTNNITDPQKLQIGQTLRIPAPASTSPSPTSP